MANMTVTLGDLADETLANLYRGSERPRHVTIGSTALSTPGATQLTTDLPDESPPTTILEAPDGEQMLVTEVSGDATPILTVSRGYNNTVNASGWPTNTELLVEPRWGRVEVIRWIRRWFSGPGNTFSPYVTSQVMLREPGLQYIVMPADAIRVVRVRHFTTLTGRIVDIAGWQFETNLPASITPTGQVLRLPTTVWDEDELIVEWQAPYEWTGTGESATITVPVGADDLPILYAAAYGVARREVTRVELDKVTEWNQEQAARAGINLRLLRDMWGEYYRRVDESRKIQDVPKHRPYRKMAKVK